MSSRSSSLRFAALTGVIAATIFTGCTSVGTKNLDNVGAFLELRQGQSTKHDVYARFGQPGDVVYQGAIPGSASSWVFYHVDARLSGWSYVPYIGLLAGGVRENRTQANFLFDPKGKFTKVATAKDSTYVNQWRGIVQGTYRINTDTKAKRVEEEMARLGKPFDKKLAKKLADRR